MRLAINGERILRTSGFGEPDDSADPRVQATFPNFDSLKRSLSGNTPSELTEAFVGILCPVPLPVEHVEGVALITPDRLEGPPEISLVVQCTFLVEEWRGPWTIRAYSEAVEETFRNRANQHATGPHDVNFSGLVLDQETTYFAFERTVALPGSDVVSELESLLSVLGGVLEEARATLEAEVERTALVTFFDFPPAVSTACGQYLLYFVQFLRDLGIDADASIRQEAQQVLFSVTPTSGPDALDRIREALDVYLNLPGSPEFASEAGQLPDIAVQQLRANVTHLEGQILLAGAVLQARNAEVEALRLSNLCYEQLLANAQQVGALPLEPSQESDAESLIPGVVKVVPYKGKGFEVNTPEILRFLKRLKRRFGGESE